MLLSLVPYPIPVSERERGEIYSRCATRRCSLALVVESPMALNCGRIFDSSMTEEELRSRREVAGPNKHQTFLTKMGILTEEKSQSKGSSARTYSVVQLHSLCRHLNPHSFSRPCPIHEFTPIPDFPGAQNIRCRSRQIQLYLNATPAGVDGAILSAAAASLTRRLTPPHLHCPLPILLHPPSPFSSKTMLC